MKKLFVLIFTLFILIGCSSSKIETMEFDSKSDYDAPESEMVMEDTSDSYTLSKSNGNVVSQNKIIKNTYLSVETIEFDMYITSIENKIFALGGYIENSSINNYEKGYRNAHYTIRIPQNEQNNFITYSTQDVKVVRREDHSEDVTSNYIDTERRKEVLLVQEERILNLLKKAEDIDDILTLERELSRIREEIERLQVNLNRWDNLVEYTTISLSVQEIQDPDKINDDEEAFSSKAKTIFIQSINSLINVLETIVLVFVALVPYLLIFVPITLFVIFIIKRLKK